jgi:hypothetical protein
VEVGNPVNVQRFFNQVPIRIESKGSAWSLPQPPEFRGYPSGGFYPGALRIPPSSESCSDPTPDTSSTAILLGCGLSPPWLPFGSQIEW